jgi:hypothetical protein
VTRLRVRHRGWSALSEEVTVRAATPSRRTRSATGATAEDIIARYAARWSIEVTFFDVKNILGVGEARNRVARAVERTVRFGLFSYSILILWYALYGHADTDADTRRDAAPWYRTKTEPSTLDMLVKLRRQISPPDFCPPPPTSHNPRNHGSRVPRTREAA